MAKILTLRRCALFKQMTYRELAVLAPRMEEAKAGANTWIAKEGEKGDGLIILCTGKIALSSHTSDGTSVELGPGDFFGELSLVEKNHPRAVGARAMENCEYLKLKTSSFEALMAEAPEVAGKMAQGVLHSVAQKVGSLMKLGLNT